MANLLLCLESGIEQASDDLHNWMQSTGKVIEAAPGVCSALAALAVALEKPLAELALAAENPLNIPLDLKTARDLAAVWPEVKKFLSSIGVC